MIVITVSDLIPAEKQTNYGSFLSRINWGVTEDAADNMHTAVSSFEFGHILFKHY